MQPETPTEDLLVIDEPFERASTGKRLLNYIIDFIAFYFLAMLIVIGYLMIFPENVDSLESDSFGSNLLDRLVTLVLYGVYMGAIEYFFKGKSFGKLITGTRAVTLRGNPISGSTAFLRGISRAVPFEPFSALGNPSDPWHDKWTDSMVIDERKTIR
jgi:uncharacterized RDD family membrane protein YckC